MRLHVHEWGDRGAPPLVCLHGVTGHGRRFRKLVEERLARHFRVLAPDLRGHGRSGWDPPWDLATHVRDVVETARAAGVAGAAWLGHSFGGRLILELAAAHPELIERSVLLDPAIEVAPPEGRVGAERERVEKAFATVEDAIAQRMESGPLYHTPRDILEEEMREHLVHAPDGLLRYRYCQSAVVTAWGEMCKPAPDVPRLATLVVLGAHSEFVSEEQIERYRERLGELLEVAVVPGGHMVYWDAFEETADAVESFLTPSPASSSAARTRAS